MTINIEDVIATYIELRDTKQQMKAEYDAAVKPINDAMENAEQRLREFFNSTGQTSSTVKGVGTAYISRQTSAKVADWDTFFPFVHANNLWHMLEHRVSKTAAEQYTEMHGEPPPGIDISTTITVNVRR